MHIRLTMLGSFNDLTIPTTLALLDSFSSFFSVVVGRKPTFVEVVGDSAGGALKDCTVPTAVPLVPPLSSEERLPRGA